MEMDEHSKAKLIAGVGIEGDRYATGKGYYSKKIDVREVTLIEMETLDALLRDHKVELTPDEHRRNLTVRDVPLNHLVGRRFRVGSTILEGARLNVPCKYLDQLLDKEVFEFMRFRSGLNCRIIEGGSVNVGDIVEPLSAIV
jgi:MOSC domain-containing protein YiiM